MVCPSGAWFENTPYLMPSIHFAWNPKHVIVQWVGIGTHTHTVLTILLQTKKNISVFVRKLHLLYIFHFISKFYDAHLQTWRCQLSVLGNCCSVPTSIFVWFIPFQVFLIMLYQSILCKISKIENIHNSYLFGPLVSDRGRREIGISGSLIWSKTLM